MFRHEAINGDGRCPTYLHRWTLIRLPTFAVYIHHFVGNDWSKDYHDHPKHFVSIGIVGSYVEHILDTKSGKESSVSWSAPWVRKFDSEHAHRIEVCGKRAWTIALVGKINREWGFWHKGKWVHWNTYVNSSIAEAMQYRRGKLAFLILLPIFLCLIAAVVTVPSTKTAAAMLTIPVIVSNETLQADASEIYSLGMERLKEVLEDEQP